MSESARIRSQRALGLSELEAEPEARGTSQHQIVAGRRAGEPREHAMQQHGLREAAGQRGIQGLDHLAGTARPEDVDGARVIEIGVRRLEPRARDLRLPEQERASEDRLEIEDALGRGEARHLVPGPPARGLTLGDLEHLGEAWDQRFAKDHAELAFAAQEIVLTVPASFDASARDLTVEAAVALSGARGVDVSSGVERAHGVKDAGKITAFIGAARRAFARAAEGVG